MTTLDSVDARVHGLGYRLFDADNHYYEAEDAFVRYPDPRLGTFAPRWVNLADGSKRLIFADRMNRYLGADQTFEKVGRPGIMAQGKAGVIRQTREGLEPARPEYRDRDARLSVMDRQGIEATLLFPTMGVSIESLLADDAELTYGCLHSFNRWLDDDWGFNYQNRLYGVPLLSLLDPFYAMEELDYVLAAGARTINLRVGPVGRRSPGDRFFDPFWKMVADADITVVFHGCDDSYRYEMGQIWGWGNINVPARHIPPLHRLIAGHGRPVHDMVATLLYGKLFERFPSLRIALIELGSAWVPKLLENLAVAGRGDLDEDPGDVFRRHFSVAPFEDEDVVQLTHTIGADRVLFGSDYPHTDGLAEPASFVDVLTGLDEVAVRKIVRDNARSLVEPQKSAQPQA